LLKLEALNDKQREAVTYESGNLLVLAGPGSGKTFTIVQRIFYLIEKMKVAPEQILVISFTKDSAMEMQNRFLSNCDTYYPVAFGTFHSIFYYILRECSNQNISLINNSVKNQYISNIIKKLLANIRTKDEGLLTMSEINSVSEKFIAAISYYKNTLDKSKASQMLPDKQMMYFDTVYEEYEKKRKSNSYIDFDDMISDCYSLFKNNANVRKRWNSRFSYILIDEFQDINPIQYETVKILLGSSGRLFAVGDDDQSIYNFRGAEPDCLKKVIRECNCSIINLQYNYRNPEEIRRYANRLINENVSRIGKDSVSMSPGLEVQRIFIEGCENKDLHYEKIATLLENNQQEEWAVLFRTNIEMQRMAVILNKRGISFLCCDKRQNIYEHFIFKDIMAYLKCAYLGVEANELLRILNKPVRYINREAIEGGPDILNNILNYGSEHFNKKMLENANILKKDLSFIKERHLYPAINYILMKIGYKKYILDSVKGDELKLQEYTEVFDWLLSDCKSYSSLEDYLESQKEYAKNIENSVKNSSRTQFKQICDIKCENKDENKGENPSEKCVMLMTAHASKGLEFKNVIIAECNEGNFPHGKMPDSKTTEEERRLFYVAVTRSSERLYIYYIKGTKERIATPSRFINCLLDAKKDKND